MENVSQATVVSDAKKGLKTSCSLALIIPEEQR